MASFYSMVFKLIGRVVDSQTFTPGPQDDGDQEPGGSGSVPELSTRVPDSVRGVLESISLPPHHIQLPCIPQAHRRLWNPLPFRGLTWGTVPGLAVPWWRDHEDNEWVYCLCWCCSIFISVNYVSFYGICTWSSHATSVYCTVVVLIAGFTGHEAGDTLDGMAMYYWIQTHTLYTN